MAFAQRIWTPNGTVSLGSTELNRMEQGIADAHRLGRWEPVRAVVTTAKTIANPGGSTFDGAAVSAGDRLLLTAQAAASDNGIYVFNGPASPMARALDADESGEFVLGRLVVATAGANAGSTWSYSSVSNPTLGVTSLTFRAVTPAPIVHEVNAAGEPGFKNSWVNFDGGWTRASFWRDGNYVFVRGLVAGGTVGDGVPIFTLPTGYRPVAPGLHQLWATYCQTGIARISVRSNGDVCADLAAAGGNGYLDLSPIFFLGA